MAVSLQGDLWFMEDYMAENLKERIIKEFEKFNRHISIKEWKRVNKRFLFFVKPKGNTRESHIRANAEDVRLRLKLPLFQVYRNDNCLLLIVSVEKPEYPSFFEVISDPGLKEWMDKGQLPYVVGHDSLGRLCAYDLATFPHLLLGGSTYSGKSVGLQSVITSIAVSKSPAEVNFVLIDVGASNLMFFENLPHLSCPVICNRETAVQALESLVEEMERRSSLEFSAPEELERLPQLVLVIDEFRAMFTGGLSKTEIKIFTDSVSSILERGRHGNVHVVLAAQNPTFQNVKIGLGNITARAAFKCAKNNFSETIIGEGGAEKLAGLGEMLFLAPNSSKPIFIQGICIDKKQLGIFVKRIEQKWKDETEGRFLIHLPTTSAINSCGYKTLTDHVKMPTNCGEDELFAKVLIWAFSNDEVSKNAVMGEFGIGWKKSRDIVEKMTELGILSEQRAKLPRKVIPNSLSQLPEELIAFMENNGRGREDISAAFSERYKPEVSEEIGTQNSAVSECKSDIGDSFTEDMEKSTGENKSIVVADFADNSMNKNTDCESSDATRMVKQLFSDIGFKRKEELARQKQSRKNSSLGCTRIRNLTYLYNCTGAIMWALSQNYVSRRKLQSLLLKDGKRVDALIYRMEVWQIICRERDGSQWKVLPNCLDDLSDEAKEYLLSFGQTEERLNSIFEKE